MSTKCLLVSVNELVSVAIESLLTTQGDLEVVHTGAGSEAGLMEAINLQQPDVIILDEGSELYDQTKLVNLLMRYPNLRLITINRQDNQLHVYQQQVVLVTQFSDLIPLLYDQ